MSPGLQTRKQARTFRGSRGPGSRLGWSQISFLVDFFVLKGHMRERERDIKMFSFFSDEIVEMLMWRERC